MSGYLKMNEWEKHWKPHRVCGVSYRAGKDTCTITLEEKGSFEKSIASYEPPY